MTAAYLFVLLLLVNIGVNFYFLIKTMVRESQNELMKSRYENKKLNWHLYYCCVCCSRRVKRQHRNFENALALRSATQKFKIGAKKEAEPTPSVALFDRKKIIVEGENLFATSDDFAKVNVSSKPVTQLLDVNSSTSKLILPEKPPQSVPDDENWDNFLSETRIGQLRDKYKKLNRNQKSLQRTELSSDMYF